MTAEPPPDLLYALTPRERDCLALVAAGLRSKEIAPLLNIESSTVDVTLKRAAKRTGISDRKALARLLLEREPDLTQSVLQRLGHSSISVVSPTISRPERSIGRQEEPVGRRQSPPDPDPSADRRWQDLSVMQKRLWAAIIAAGSLAIGGIMLSAARYLLNQAAWLKW